MLAIGVFLNDFNMWTKGGSVKKHFSCFHLLCDKLVHWLEDGSYCPKTVPRFGKTCPAVTYGCNSGAHLLVSNVRDLIDGSCSVPERKLYLRGSGQEIKITCWTGNREQFYPTKSAKCIHTVNLICYLHLPQTRPSVSHFCSCPQDFPPTCSLRDYRNITDCFLPAAYLYYRRFEESKLHLRLLSL